MIDTKALRNRILDLAIQGKLTEQLESDGTSEELYQQIQVEKQKLIKNGKFKKEKPLPEIKEDELPFDIPSNWKWTYLGEIFQHNTGKALNASDTEGTLLEYITTSNVYWDHFELKGLKKMYFSKNEVEKCTVTKGDLLICEGGDIGRSSIWNFDFNIRIQNHLHRLRSYVSEISAKFYYYLMLLYKGKGKIDGRGIGLQGFSSKRVHGLIVPLPPLAEQKRIVQRVEEIFSVLDTIDEAQKKYSADVEILKAKLITAGIHGKLTQQLESDGTAEKLYQQIQEEKQKLIKDGKIKKEKPLPPIKGEEIPFEIPKNWKWVRLGEIVTILGGKRIPAGRSLASDNTGHKYIRVSDMKNMSVDTSNLLYVPEDIYPSISRYIINKEDVYITVAGTIGRVGTIPDELNGANLTENADRLVFTSLNKNWLVFCLSSDAIQKQITFLTTQVAQPKLAIKRIQEFCIPLPPLAEQKRIAEKLGELLGALEQRRLLL